MREKREKNKNGISGSRNTVHRVTLAFIKKMPAKDSVFCGQAENWEGQDNVIEEEKKGTFSTGDTGENHEILIH